MVLLRIIASVIWVGPTMISAKWFYNGLSLLYGIAIGAGVCIVEWTGPMDSAGCTRRGHDLSDKLLGNSFMFLVFGCLWIHSFRQRIYNYI